MQSRLLNLPLSFCCLVGLALPVWAHARVEGTVPAAGAQLSVSPDRIEIRFTESIEPRLSDFKLFNAQEAAITLAREADDGDRRHMSASVPAPLTAGEYRVEWKALSEDGHPVSGEFGFTVSP
ncbi:copper resistance CopC family protein [Rhizobium ruizarguesonis]|uniref:copper resistance CopC family protein n=1 Tax=Rhizobium ruizarguesonis TaxID=2081791 RepID=UPI00103102A3|nr:copper resistance protein CopC [Rhizobium ruizarguesonis]TBE87785.1 copper resistance protein CopC [Rhizobium ruizarguesonis]